MRQKSHLILRNLWIIAGLFLSPGLLSLPVEAQMYYSDDYYREQYYRNLYQNPNAGDQPPYPNPNPRRRDRRGAVNPHGSQNPAANLQYDPRDAEMILQDQLARANQYPQVAPNHHQPVYGNYYDHRLSDEGQVQQVMAEARQIGTFLQNRNGKACLVVDKRNFQFYLYDRNGRLLRIGPVAIGKGKTDVGAFETPVGIFPIKEKTAVDDWIRPDWYFIEEGEPIPKKWEDRRVPGFFRYKLVFDGTRYIHYAEATGGRLTHGCLGLDWQDAEAVFHTLEVGSYCIVADDNLLNRLARGEFPVRKPAMAAKPAKPEEISVTVKPSKTEEISVAVTAKADGDRGADGPSSSLKPGAPEKAFRDLW